MSEVSFKNNFVQHDQTMKCHHEKGNLIVEDCVILPRHRFPSMTYAEIKDLQERIRKLNEQT